MATILAIGTANPSNCFDQADYPDFYFRVTESEHMTQLKDKFKRICEKSKIRKRYMYLTEDIIKKNPTLGTYDAPSLDARQKILVAEVPRLGKEAALKALEEWGQPKSKITHLVFCTSSGIHMPGADHELTKLLGLKPSVKRFMMYQQGCFTAAQGLRLSKDLAENNPGARVLVVCSENMAVCFRAPSETHLDILVGSAIFSDGAAAVIVGADPDTTIERSLFQLVSAEQCIVPDSDDGIVGHIREMGMSYYLHKNVPKIVAKGAAQSLVETFSARYGIKDWNSLFYIVHPGGPGVLNKFEEHIGLTKDKLRSTRHVLTEYGNMWSPSVFFVLDEMRRRSAKEGKATTGEGLDLGVLFGFGPGVFHECGISSIFLPGIDVPDWFDFQTRRYRTTFYLPPRFGPKICGLNVCVMYSCINPEVILDNPYYAKIRIETKGQMWEYSPTFFGFPEHNNDMLWLSHWKFRDWFEAGDAMQFSVAMARFLEMKKCSVHLVYEQQDDDSGEIVQSTSLWYEILTDRDLTAYKWDNRYYLHHHDRHINRLRFKGNSEAGMDTS